MYSWPCCSVSPSVKTRSRPHCFGREGHKRGGSQGRALPSGGPAPRRSQLGGEAFQSSAQPTHTRPLHMTATWPHPPSARHCAGARKRGRRSPQVLQGRQTLTCEQTVAPSSDRCLPRGPRAAVPVPGAPRGLQGDTPMSQTQRAGAQCVTVCDARPFICHSFTIS